VNTIQATIETAELERIKSEVEKTIAAYKVPSSAGTITMRYHKSSGKRHAANFHIKEWRGKLVPDGEMLWEERVPKRLWTKQDIKNVKRLQGLSQMVSPLFSDVMAAAAKAKAKEGSD
jgi:hypothetical protein